LTEMVSDGKLAGEGSTAREFDSRAATAWALPGQESRTAGDASRMVKRASISDEAFSWGLEERGQQAVEPCPRSSFADAFVPEESSGRDQEWMPWKRRDKLQPSAVSASALAASSYRFLSLHVGRSCWSTRSIVPDLFNSDTSHPPVFRLHRLPCVHLARIESWVAHKRTVAIVVSCPLTSDGANSGPVPCRCGGQRHGTSCGRPARLVRLVFVLAL
jgi:hypothetical protein